MFTGIVEAAGRLHARTIQGQAGKLVLKSPLARDLNVSDSLAVNGTCLTVERLDRDAELLYFHTLGETLNKTNLGVVPIGRLVNLERPLQLGDRLGGHLVMGHVDGTTPVQAIRQEGGDIVVEYVLPPPLKPYIIHKGSIAIDGVSLTVADLYADSFTVHLIPYTWEHTNMREVPVGDRVNLEMDMVGKYVLRREQLLADGWRP
jgi:riboflavin synthase